MDSLTLCLFDSFFRPTGRSPERSEGRGEIANIDINESWLARRIEKLWCQGLIATTEPRQEAVESATVMYPTLLSSSW